MVNIQSSIIHYIKEQLKSDFRIGEYPFDVEKYGLGDWDNVALIQDGNESLIEDGLNKHVHKEYLLHIWYYSNDAKHRIDHILDQQAKIEDYMLDDGSLDGNADCIDIINIDKGESLENFTGYLPGYHGNKSCRVLTFRIIIKQER